MKLHRLELEGFGPFRARQSVDFDAFDDDGIFLISGRTGAGKSSILDGVCFALYGMVPRYDGASRRLRSDHSAPDEPTEVTLEFSAHTRRYRITRAPEYERPKARGEGFTTEKARVSIEVREGAGWRALSTQAKEAGTLIAEEIVGLTGAQFLQVILLAQNKFSDFLLAGNDERQALLRNLFGTRTYVDYETAFENRRRDSQREFDRRSDEVDFLLSDAERMIAEHALLAVADEGEPAAASALSIEDRFARIEQAIQRAAYLSEQAHFASERADAAATAARDAHTAQVALRELQRKRVVAREALQVWEARADDIASARERLARATEAEALRSSVDAAVASMAAKAQANERVAADTQKWVEVGGTGAADDAALARLVDELTGQLALWVAAQQRENELRQLEASAADLEASIAREVAQVATNDERRGAIAARVREIDAERPPLEAESARAEALQSTSELLEARLAAAREVVTLQTAARTAEERHANAVTEHALAVTAVSTLLKRRLDQAAGELASTLVDGEPCLVCGSTAHPHPADSADDAVTDDDVSAAQDAAATAGTNAERAAATARRAEAALVDARARAEGKSVEECEAQVAETHAALAQARTASTTLAGLIEDRDRLESEAASLEAQAAAVAARLNEAKERLAGVSAGLASIRAEVAVARGEFASVDARIADATERRDLARALLEARTAHAAAERACDEAAAARDARIADSPFADADAVTDALLPAAERSSENARIREHDAQLAAHREALRGLELDLAGAPEELVDTSATEAAAQFADAARAAATATATTAAFTEQRLRDVNDRARLGHTDSAEAAATHRVIVGLADAIAGRNAKKMDLETFVLAAELEEIAVAAARRLEEMSGGRYRMRHTDALAARNRASGLGLEIVDAHTGKARTPQSLSGGETFLASLALALGLAEVVTARAGGVRLDTLFIDEGFGSLDAETLEMAMSTLDELRQGGRTVGIISHVAAMKDRIPARVEVHASAQGASIIRQAAAVAY